MLLEIHDLVASYGNKEVLHRVSLEVKTGEIVALLGHNGAGKTTALKSIFGLLPVKQGHILFNNRDVTNHGPRFNIREGMALVPQGLGLFSDFSISKNLELAGSTIKNNEDLGKRLSEIYKLFPVLDERKSQTAGTLSGGERQMVALGMAMMTNPKLLLLDEPSTGLSPALAETLIKYIGEINQRLSVSIMLVEQNISQALSVAQRVYVMKMGEIILEQDASKLAQRDQFWDLF